MDGGWCYVEMAREGVDDLTSLYVVVEVYVLAIVHYGEIGLG